jgi:hypothetical protein
MVDIRIQQNADNLEQELAWFQRYVENTIKLYFDEKEAIDHNALKPPTLTAESSTYGNFLLHYDFSLAERIVLLLALVPNIRPQLLDVFNTLSESMHENFSGFGGVKDPNTAAYTPTGETAMFLICGDDLSCRFQHLKMFDAEHVFHDHNILRLMSTASHLPDLKGTLLLSKEVLELLTMGVAGKPKFSKDFPAKRIQSQMEWKDLVLDGGVMDQVEEILSWMKHGQKLLNELELGNKVKPGYRALFYGPSGTGKTLTASLIGKVSNREVYQVDLSLVVSKYIGETEQNLEKIFAQAENKNWIIFFDEGESLFSKRTQVSDAHDRFANQEVSYLLQRIEAFPGVVILASNLKTNMDDAFTRRFQSIIYFPVPKMQERLRLWKESFSPKTSFASDVDMEKIARQYEMTGGMIINVVRYATLKSLQKNSLEITLQDIEDGIKKESYKEGKINA